ncbi:MAG: hypothetical protein HY789_02820 [Deltaproteobacteria bacterium]|nr:hypothetical protein [Deltaproteobacteria bacterium]
MVMETKDILGLAIDRASAINGYWNLYIAVATGLVGVMSSGKGFTRSRSLQVFLTVAFVIFAYSNLDAILRLGELRTALLDMLPAGMEAIGKSLQPARPWQYIAFHGTLDLLVVAAIWFVPWPQSDHDG